MPEGPEHYFAAKYINHTCRELTFFGDVKKSELANNQSKHPDVKWNADQYEIQACSRGKEVRLTLIPIIKDKRNKNEKTARELHLVFQFGMSGSFCWSTLSEVSKHSHLRFYVKNPRDDKQVFSYHDPRRFGRWRIGDSWSDERGPDPVFEYELFRANVIDNLSNTLFRGPICEVLLNQKYFNGIGNYLRAEILYRANIPPFERSKDVIESVINKSDSKTSDILKVCSEVAKEAMDLYDTPGRDYTYIYTGGDQIFFNWVKCYSKPNMNSLVDKNGRTIWFYGEPGPLAPKKSKKLKLHSKSPSKTKKIKEKEPNKKLKSAEAQDSETGPVTRSRKKKLKN